MKQPQQRDGVEPPERRLNWTIVALLAGVVLLVIVIAYFARSGNPDQDKLTNAEIAKSTPVPSSEKLCAGSQTYDLIKRELFRRAAQLRGSDQATFDRLSGYAVIRMDNPVMESQDSSMGAVNCAGSLSLDLPPGVAVVGGRRTLMSDVDYTVTKAADGSGTVVLLRNADAIITPLATLAKVNQAPQQAPAAAESNEATPETTQTAPVTTQAPSSIANSTPAPLRPVGARPSFDCATARRPGEVAVCSNAGLAALDRQMAAQYSRAFALASPDQREMLRDSARRFYDFRDRCSTNACIADAYTGRMREISDIMEGRWQPPR